MQTRITFNGGGTWQKIKAPSKFNFQKCDRCGGAKECSLHLHGELPAADLKHSYKPYSLVWQGNGVWLDQAAGGTYSLLLACWLLCIWSYATSTVTPIH